MRLRRLLSHRRFWSSFWARSFVHVTTPDDFGARLTADIAISRYMDACSGRHRFPIDNDGFLFTWPGRDAIYAGAPAVRSCSLRLPQPCCVADDVWSGNRSQAGFGKTDVDWRYWGSGFWVSSASFALFPCFVG